MNDHAIHQNESGQTIVEYGFIILLVSIAAVVTLPLVGQALAPVFADIASKF